jgi:hypothetical protein
MVIRLASSTISSPEDHKAHRQKQSAMNPRISVVKRDVLSLKNNLK